MRLHTLSIQAFGPFGGHTQVDFDAVTESGLFLFTGPTGSGKTSVLDAVCFALYGSVPGTRQVARQLRSDHANPDVAPEVQLEFSSGGRRLRIRRSPAWERPKRRGTGMTTQPASVLVEEFHDDGWTPLSTRLDEAGDLVVGLLGMHPGQFTQVAMLPQGEFQRFLAARSDDRQAILQRLFRTDRFAQIETWLRERRSSLRRASEAHRSEVGLLLSRVQEVAATELPAEWDEGELGRVARGGGLREWCARLRAETAASHRAAAADLEAHQRDVDTGAAAVHDAQSLAATQQRARRAQDSLDRLEETAPVAERSRQRLLDHRRAQPALALGRQHSRAMAHLVEAKAQASVLLRDAGLQQSTTLAQARSAHGAIQRRLHSIDDFLPRLEELEATRIDLTGRRAEIDRLASRITELAAEESELPQRRLTLEADLLAARLAAQDLPRLQTATRAVRASRQAADRLRDVSSRAALLREQVLAATERHQQLRERHQDIREARISAMAGELAAGLAAGCSCPVCGSESHPSPALQGDAVGRDDEDRARSAVDDAAIELETLRDSLRSIEHEVTGLTDASGGRDVDHWQQALTEAEDSERAATALAARCQEFEEALAAADSRGSALREELAEVRERHAAATTSIASLHDNVADLEQQAARLLEGRDEADIRTARDALVEQASAQGNAVGALESVESATAAEQRLAEAVLAEAETAGFAGWPEVEAAGLTDAEVRELERGLRDRDREAAVASATLSDPEVAAALELDPPPLTELAAALEQARRRCESTRDETTRLERLQGRLSELEGRLTVAVGAWLPVLEEHELVAGLTELVEGSAADHTVRMRLSAYVLGERLRAVVDAANDRLARMGLDRFSLEQSDSATGRDRRGGLGLQIRDAWTSTLRETGTLSGGETFMVSLALALGLADTVTAESGGTRIDTLFVDEGFGSLDSEALEGVLDTLDSLREGGRAVGVISHVTEMRERIPTQVAVRPLPEGGSTLELVLGA